MADEPVSFTLDLDASDFVDAGNTALNLIGQIGDPSNLEGLISTLGSAAEALGIVGLAVGGFKLALDMTLEGEKIQQIDNQFNTLASQAGISGSALKAALVDASGGLVSTNDLLQSANKALVELGPSASSLPEVMTISRQAVTLFGGDVKTTFDEMTQALANGNTRWLTHHGIIINTNQALKTFADQNGIAVDALSESGKKQALFNAGLEAAQKRFTGVAESMGPTTDAYTQFTVALKELKELLDVLVSKVLGKPLASAFELTKNAIHDTTTEIKSFGSGSEAVAAQTEILKSRIADITKHIQELQTHTGRGIGIDASAAKVQIDQMTLELQKYQKQLEQIQATKKQSAAQDKQEDAQIQKTASARAAANKAEITDQQKILKEKANFEAQKAKLEEATAKEEVKLISTVEQVDAQMDKQKLLREQQHAAAIKKIQSDTALNHTQKIQLMAAEDKRYHTQEMAMEKQDAAERLKLLQQMQQNQKKTWDAFASEAKVASQKARNDLANVGKQGKTMYDNLSKDGVSAFEKIGASIAQGQNIAKATADAMKNAFLGFIGQTAEQYGEMLLLESVYPPNPVGLAAGAALLAFGGALSALGGSSGGVSTGASASPSTGSTAAPPSPTTQGSSSSDTSSQLQQQQQVQRTVSINIAGNYMNSQETNRSIMEIMRNEVDATGFNFYKIGV